MIYHEIYDLSKFRLHDDCLNLLLASDCETKSEYELIIIAIDQAEVGQRLSATTTFAVEITGTNEFYPQWDASSDTQATVNEGTATSGSVVATVLATDDDRDVKIVFEQTSPNFLFEYTLRKRDKLWTKSSEQNSD